MQTTTPTARRSSLVKIGGALGIAGSCIALGTFLFALFGFDAVFMMAPLPLVLGTIGIIIAVVGAVTQRLPLEEDTQPIAALFVCLTAILAGAIECYVWMNMPWH